MSSNLLRLLTTSSSRLSRVILKRPNSQNLIFHRSVQEFPDLKYNNEAPKDYVLILPEAISQNSDANEVLRIPKANEPATDYSKLTLESVFLGVHQAITNYENFITDFNNGLVEPVKSLEDFFKLVEHRLFPMDTAYFTLSMLASAKPAEYNHVEIYQLKQRYFKAREKRFDGGLRDYIQDYLTKNPDKSLRDIEKKLLSLYNKLGPNAHKLRTERVGSVNMLRNHLRSSRLEFAANVHKANQEFSHTVDDPDIIAVVSPEFDDCQDLHHKERTPLEITASTYHKFMRVCPDRFVRQMLWETYNRRCSPKGSPRNNNLNVINRIQVQKRKIADYLGYRTYFEERLENSIVGSRREVLDNLTRLNAENQPKMSELLNDLYDFASSDNFEDPNGIGFQVFDFDYFVHKYTYDILIGKSERQLRTFFPLTNVMQGLKQYFKKYFDIEIKSSDRKLWSNNVKSYEVSRNGIFQGEIIFNPFKPDGGQHNGTFYSRVRGRNNIVGSLPIRYAASSYSIDAATNEALLSPTDVINLINLYSTVIQRLLYNFEYYELNLYGALEHEVIDLLPNLCMAHLLTDHRILQSCSNRGESKPIDSGMASKILKTLHHFAPLRRWHQFYQTHIDIEFHCTMRDIKPIAEELHKVYSPFARLVDNYDYCTMSDVILGPNDAIQYANIISKQLANHCLQSSVSQQDQVDDISQVDVNKIRDFNVKLLDTLFDPRSFDTKEKLASLTDSSFEPTKSSLGVL